jgi:hypothetical protein
MSQPDSLSSVDSITFAVPTAILVFFVAFMLFQWEFLWPYFRVVLYLGVPLFIYAVTSVVTLLAQYSGCGVIKAGDVFLNSLPSVGLSWAALFLSYFSWCRIPIASVVAPLFLRNESGATEGAGTEGKACCAPRMTLETVELQAPMVKGFSYGFYLFFSTIFGLLISIGMSSVC